MSSLVSDLATKEPLSYIIPLGGIIIYTSLIRVAQVALIVKVCLLSIPTLYFQKAARNKSFTFVFKLLRIFILFLKTSHSLIIMKFDQIKKTTT